MMTKTPDVGSDGEPLTANKTGSLSPEWIQADIARAFELRRDYYKYIVGVTTALLAFTVSFPPTLAEIAYRPLVLVFWLALGMALLCGIVVHYIWAWFFISFRDLDSRGRVEGGRERRRRLNRLRRSIEIIQLMALVVGVLGTAAFAAANLENLPAGA